MLGGQLGLGYDFDNGFRVESVLGYRGGELSVPSAFGPGLTGVASDPHGNLQIADLMVNGIYDFQFLMDGTLLTFPSRFTFVIDLEKESPILHHHSSQVPRTLT